VRIGHGYNNPVHGSTSASQVGQQYVHSMPPPPIPSGQLTTMVSKKPWPTWNNGQHIGGPKVFTPGQNANTMDIPDFFDKQPQQPGYQEAHAMYDKMRTHFAQQAHRSNHELVVVKVTMKSLKPGNKNLSIVSVSASEV
jgi:hypothetical protein